LLGCTGACAAIVISVPITTDNAHTLIPVSIFKALLSWVLCRFWGGRKSLAYGHVFTRGQNNKQKHQKYFFHNAQSFIKKLYRHSETFTSYSPDLKD
jgi:hypothetical protein